jgi:hypothetical protein
MTHWTNSVRASASSGKQSNKLKILFREYAVKYSGDLLWMGPVAFRYYAPAYVRYLLSEHSIGDSDAVNCFHGLIKFRMESGDGSEMAPIADLLAACCHHVLQHYEKFDIDPNIYGDLKPHYEALLISLGRLERK